MRKVNKLRDGISRKDSQISTKTFFIKAPPSGQHTAFTIKFTMKKLCSRKSSIMLENK